MFPIVRVRALRSFAATTARVRPRARTFLYSSDLSSAWMKSHQLTCSHSPKRRSSHEVTKTMSRSTKYASSCGGSESSWKRVEEEPPHPVRRPRLVRVGRDAEDRAVGAALRARRLRLVRLDEVVPDAVRVAGERDPAHRVRHVVVEAGEEAEAVLARQRLAPARGGAGHRDAARLAAERLALVDVHAEAALDELVRGREARHAAAEDGHPLPAPGRGTIARPPALAHEGVAASGGGRRARLQHLPP